jgi:hypothetical protein
MKLTDSERENIQKTIEMLKSLLAADQNRDPLVVSEPLLAKRVKRLRGTVSQENLAARMRLRGFSWVKATVWNIENGTRQLKFLECLAFLDVLQIPRMEGIKALSPEVDYEAAR